MSDWQDLLVPRETFEAYGTRWRIAVFTGTCTGPSGRGGMYFVDSSGRSEGIDLRGLSADINDRLSMALFIHPDGSHGSYFYLYNHSQKTEIDFADVAVADLSYRGTPGWSRRPWHKGIVAAGLAQFVFPFIVNVSGETMPLLIRLQASAVVAIVVAGVVVFTGRGADQRRFAPQLARIRSYVKRL